MGKRFFKGWESKTDKLGHELMLEIDKVCSKNIPFLEENIKGNLKEGECPDIRELKLDLINRALLVIGNGPSLDDHLEDLHKIDTKKVKVFCTDRPFRKVVDAGLEPQYFLNLDGQVKNHNFTKGVDTKKVTGIWSLTTRPENRDVFDGPIYWYIPALYYDDTEIMKRFLGKYVISQTCGNVGSTSLFLGYFFRCFPIFSLGVDFTYSDAVDPAKQFHHGNSIPRTFVDNRTGASCVSDTTLWAYSYSTKKMLRHHNFEIVKLGRKGGLLQSNKIKYLPWESFLKGFGRR